MSTNVDIDVVSARKPAIVHNAFNQYDSLMAYIETGHDIIRHARFHGMII